MNKITVESARLAAGECLMTSKMWLEHNIKSLQKYCPKSPLIEQLQDVLLQNNASIRQPVL